MNSRRLLPCPSVDTTLTTSVTLAEGHDAIVTPTRALPRAPFAYELVVPGKGIRTFTDEVQAWAWACAHLSGVDGVVGRKVRAAV